MVISKHAPITPFILSAIDALAKNTSGVTFTATDAQGNQKQIVESQLFAEILNFYRSLTQVMIGEAVSASEVRSFVKEKEKDVK